MTKNHQIIVSVSLVIVLICLIEDVSSTRLAAARVGTCFQKKAYGIIRMKKFECQKMGGRWNGRPGSRSWTDCHLDWCEIPNGRRRKENCSEYLRENPLEATEYTRSYRPSGKMLIGQVAKGRVWFVCPAWQQRARSGRTYGIVRMQKYQCDVLNGKFNGRPGLKSWMNCHLYFCGVDGRNKENIWGVVPTTVGERRNVKLAYGIIRMPKNNCKTVRGKVNSWRGSWLDCHLDWTISD